MLVLFLFGIASSILTIISLWKIYTKAKQPGWASIIPFYSEFVLYRLTWGEGIYFLFTYVAIPVVPFIMSVITIIKLARSFRKSDGFAVGLILLPVVFFPILAFGSSEYAGPIRRLGDEE